MCVSGRGEVEVSGESQNANGSPVPSDKRICLCGKETGCWMWKVFISVRAVHCYAMARFLKVILFFLRYVSRATLRVGKQLAWIILRKLPALRYWIYISWSTSLSRSFPRLMRKEQQGMSPCTGSAPPPLFTVQLRREVQIVCSMVPDAKIPVKPVD